MTTCAHGSDVYDCPQCKATRYLLGEPDLVRPPANRVALKAAYVRRQLREDAPTKHTCHWPGCSRQVQPAVWGCLPHWRALPLRFRARIWAHYTPGQERTKTPSIGYVETARAIQEWIAQQPTKG